MKDDRQLAVVTGASRGIGRVVAQRLAAGGHTVVAIGRSAAELATLAEQTGAVPLVLDVSDRTAVSRAWAEIEAKYGPPNLVVNNAGVSGTSGPTAGQDDDDWWRVFEINMLGTFLVTRAALPSMVTRGSGRIVNVSSNAAFFEVWNDNDGSIGSAYMASKAAVIRFTEAVAGEVAPAGVQAFAISPGTVKTDMTAVVFADEWDDPDLWTEPEVAAELIELLASGALDALTGRYIHAGRDDWRGMATRSAAIIADDLHTMRVRTA